MIHEPTKLVLGRGEVYFDRFLDGTRIGEGERYLGNTITFRVQRNIQTRERATSYRGTVVQRDPIVTSESHVVNFTTDHVDLENLALWFGGDALDQVFTQNLITETFIAKRGRFLQLGKTQNVAGVRNVSEVIVKIGNNFVESAGNFRVDPNLGRIWIFPDAVSIPNESVLTITFVIRRSDSAQTRSNSSQIKGSLRFLAFNQGSVQNDVFIPFVSLSPRGQVDLKGDEWQQWSFDAEVFNLNPSTQQVYVTRSARRVQLTIGEETVIDQFGSFEAFFPLEDELHQSVNFGWPPALELGVI